MVNNDKVFIDTDFLVALYDANDKLHDKALRLLTAITKLRLISYLSINILIESLTIISQRKSKKEGLSLLNELRSGRYQIINLSEKIITFGEDIFKSIKSKNVSYSDCLSFAVMKENKIKWVFSFDEHFRKQGFKRIGIEGYPKE